MIAHVHDIRYFANSAEGLNEYVMVEWIGGDGWAYLYLRRGQFEGARIGDRIEAEKPD